MKYPIGTKYTLKRPKYSRKCTVVDHYKTYNLAGELVKERYVCSHELLGQTVIEHDVVETTIAIALSKGG